MRKKIQDQEYTYKDYLTWPKGEHWELIDGEAYPTYGPTALAAPTTTHQRLVRELMLLIGNYLRGKQCEVFDSPIDVVFEESESTRTVVQPDILVVCDPSKVREKNIVGAPDIAIEVLSPSTAPKDWMKKSSLYERQGVKEYWIVSPETRAIHKNTLEDGHYQTTAFQEGSLTSEVLEDFSLNIDEFFGVLDMRQKARESRIRQEEKLEIAKKLLQKGVSPEDIADATGLDSAAIAQL